MNRSLSTVILLLALFLFGTVATAFGEATWISLNGSTSPQKPTVVVLSSDASGTMVKITTSGFWSENVQEDGVTYQVLHLPGYAGTLDIGKANMPVVSELLGIPGSARVSVSVVDSKEMTLSDYTVYPFQTPLREAEKRVTFDIDQAFYRQNTLFPEQLASIGEPAIWRDLRVANLRVNPIRYNPGSSELKVCTEITVFVENSGVSTVNTKAALKRPVTDNYDRMYRQAVLNYSDLNLQVDAEVDAVYDYLIIAADAYVSNMTSFVNWKNAEGLATTIVPISTVGSDYTSIKNYILNEYNNSGISYVLLVGNETDIPAYTGYGFFSDYYYSLLDGSDDYADIAIGRFAVDNATHVNNMVNKSITFGTTPPAGNWLEKSLLVANKEEAPDKYQGCKEEIRTAAEIPGNNYSVLYPDFTTCYGAALADGGDEASNADVVNYFNEGYRLVNYRGHGDELSWQYWNVYGEYFRISNVDAINNGSLTPVVFSIACLNNNLLYSQTTIGEAFTQADDCAVAYLGATDPSYTTPNHDYDKALYATVFDEGINALGDASNEASVRVINLWGSYGITNARMYLWLGDPSLGLIFEGETGPDAPNLVSPDDGAAFDPPATPVLDWDAVADAVSYHVMIDNNSDFSSPVGEAEGLTVTQWTSPSLDVGTYYWRVRATDGALYGGWSQVRTLYVGDVPEAPVLYAPSDDAWLRNAPNLELSWYQIDGVAGYTVEIDNNSDFSSPTQTGYADDCSGGICSYYIDPALSQATYYWRVKAINDNWPWSDVWSFRLQGRVRKDDVDGIPTTLQLHANYPNPFNPTTEICFGLPQAGQAKLEIYNLMGQKVSTLVDGTLSAGYHTYTWNAAKEASGVYLYRLTTEESVISKKMLLVK